MDSIINSKASTLAETNDDDKLKISYEEEFEEIKCIGRGNFGAAFLVKLRQAPADQEIYFIAKKIILGQLTEKEKEGAHLEADLLRQLDHPNIVSYKHSFIEKGILIIIMEFCEHGDLAYHVRKKKQKDERFSETEIMNWFVQLCLSLEYVHSRKILHRDLKTSNIFLTKDNTVKLGDFGISKVLECTQDHAMTVQGTPYYMSPEVCQNKPYTYQSDIWALGCILYELCNLKHAFHAENLLGLVFKIVQDKQEPIDGDYSDELKEIIDMLLTKDEKARPRVIDIINRPFVKQHMERFVKSAGKNNLNPQLGKKKTIQPARAKKVAELLQKDPADLTPKEKMLVKRLKKTEEDFERMKAAAAENHQNRGQAWQAMQQQFHPSQTRSSQQSGVSSIPGALPQGAPQSDRFSHLGHAAALEQSLPNSSTAVAGSSNTVRQSQMPAHLDMSQPHGASGHQQRPTHTHYGAFPRNQGAPQQEVSNPYDLYQAPGADMRPAETRHGGSQKKGYMEKPKFVYLGNEPEQELNSSTQYVNRGGGSMASEAFQVNDRSTAGSQQFQVNDRTGGSDQFQVNDRSGRSNQYQLNAHSAASSQFQVNERSAASSQFQVNERSAGTTQFQINNPGASIASQGFQVNDRSMASDQFKLPEASAASSQFQVNDRSAASSQFQVNDRSAASNQFQLNQNTGASSQFQVNDRSMASQAFNVSDGRSIGQADFQVGLAGTISNPMEASQRQMQQQQRFPPHQQPNVLLAPDGGQSRGSVDFNLSQSAAVSGGAGTTLPMIQHPQMSGQMIAHQQMMNQGGAPYHYQSIESQGTAASSQQQAATGHAVPRNARPDERPLTGTGAYHFSTPHEELELGDSDHYSDDFYSDDFDGKGADDDREDDGFAFDAAVQRQNAGGLQDVVDQYAQVLGNGGSAHQVNGDFPDSFVNQQIQVQRAYGPETEIYKTLNPKHSQAQIKPQRLRHEEAKADIQTELQNKLGRELFDQIYEQLSLEIQQDTPAEERAQSIRDICEGSEDLIQLCSKLEQIIFQEQTFSFAD